MMNTPICDFVNAYAKSGNVRLHMPGHKGADFMGVEKNDITEIDGADVLSAPKGIIAQSQRNASELFSSGATFYSCEGSSLAIRAMLCLAMRHGADCGQEGRPLVFAARNVHNVFVSAAALLDFDVEWLCPENRGDIIQCLITPEFLDGRLSSASKKPFAVYITSPDYLGNIADIKGLSAVCRRHGVLLLVDNAHGAYLNFLPESRHPLHLGADMCCDSAHKTLPVLTGGAYLHISKHAPQILKDSALKAMSLFASTSPSYLILQSLDAANRFIADGFCEKLKAAAKRVAELKSKLEAKGFTFVGDEEMKLTISAKPYGYEGAQLADILRHSGIECEFSDTDFIVFMFTVQNTENDFERLESALLAIPRKDAVAAKQLRLPRPKRAMSIREAVFSPSVTRPVEECAGRVFAGSTVSCPPAIPIVVCGETVEADSIEFLKYYGVTECEVVI